jgi:hypothetical protein
MMHLSQVEGQSRHCPRTAISVCAKENFGGTFMADHSPTGPLELGADMDYAEHDKTYHRFLGLAKYGSLVCVALLIAMAFGFFVGGFFSALILFIVVVAAGSFLLP